MWALCLSSLSALAQEGEIQANISDTIRTNSIDSTKGLLAEDTALSKKFNPKTAAIRSAILPGWGQAYNKKYWKIPIVYAALGTSAGVFFYNVKTYNQLKRAVIYKSDTIPGNDQLIDPKYRGLSAYQLKLYRNAVRQDVDYSVLAFLLLWGLNVVDATVDAHLKAFDVSPDLSLKIKPSYEYNTGTTGVSLVFTIKGHSERIWKLP